MFSYLLCVKAPTAAAHADPVDNMWGEQPFGRIVTVPRKRSARVLCFDGGVVAMAVMAVVFMEFMEFMVFMVCTTPFASTRRRETRAC